MTIEPDPPPAPPALATDELIFAVPPRWRRRSDPQHGVVVAARAPTLPPSGVRPELVLRCSTVDGDLGAWRAESLHELARHLVDFEVEDEDVFDLGDEQVVYCRFAHRLAAADVVCDQWAWRTHGLGITLTCMVAREEYLDYCDVFEAVADTVGVVPRAA